MDLDPARAPSVSGLATALLEVRMLPWRPRARVMKPSTFRDFISDPMLVGDDIAGIAIGIGAWLLLLIAAPLVVLVLAAALLSVELPLVLAVAALLLVARFAGVIPWTVLIVDPLTGAETRESYRNGLRALRRIREVNSDQRITVRWAWT
jgi:hypothetical protein